MGELGNGGKLLRGNRPRDTAVSFQEDSVAFVTSASPMVLLSVPTQICPAGASNIMCRPVPPPLGMGVTPKNFSVLGSNPTRRLGCEPVSTSQIRSLSSDVMAYGRAAGPPGKAHSLNCFVLGSNRPRKPRV